MVQKPSFAQRLKTLNIGRSHDIHYTLLSVSLRLSRPVLHCLGANGLSHGPEAAFLHFFVFHDHGIAYRSVSEKWFRDVITKPHRIKNLSAVIYWVSAVLLLLFVPRVGCDFHRQRQ